MGGAGVVQDKAKERAFFDQFGDASPYDVFSDESNARIVARCVQRGGFAPGGRVLDVGCGSGVFTRILGRHGLKAAGLDLSAGILGAARRREPSIGFVCGDAERLPFGDGSLDGVLLSGLIHHIPDPSQCAREVFRVLRPGGTFSAFDPNRRNPFMYLYRDRSSPLYSSVGVTENERPILEEEARRCFEAAGFEVEVDYLSGLAYRYVESPVARLALPVYNLLDRVLFWPEFMRAWRAFVVLSGVKPPASR